MQSDTPDAMSGKKFRQIVHVVTEALRPYADARLAVVRALREYDGAPELPE